MMIRGMHYKDFHIILSSTNSPIVMQKLLENIAFSIIFPGSGIPEWIWHQNAGSSIKKKSYLQTGIMMTSWDLLSSLFLNISLGELYVV